jgi:4-carboxymuconolactone decarboxylase
MSGNEVSHGRLPWFRPDDLNDEQRRLYDEIVVGPRKSDASTSGLVDDEGHLHGPFNAMLVDPPFGMAVQRLGLTVRYHSQLAPRVREIATLSAASATKSNFEWHAHSRLGRAAGLTSDEIESIAAGSIADSFNDVERLVLRATQSLLEERDLNDALFAEVHETLGDAVLFELIVLVGLYELLARSLRVWRTPLPDDSEPRFTD